MSKRLTTEEFIVRANSKHNTYDYSLVNYINNHTNINIICSIHGVFEQTPSNHLAGQGCPKCGDTKLTTEMFIKKATLKHGYVYNYSLVNYSGTFNKVKIICHEHGVFEQKPAYHLEGKGCPICAGKNMDTNIFISRAKKLNGNLYDYSLTDYIRSDSKVKIICLEHGVFDQDPSDHLSGGGCPVCKSSKSSKVIIKFLNENNIKFTPEKKFPDCKNIKQLPFDFYLPDLNTCIEFNGRQHYDVIDYFGGLNRLKEQQKRDKIKKDYCLNNKIKLLIIPYYKDINSELSSFLF